MSDYKGDHYDYHIRQWTVDSAIILNKKGVKVDKIIADARKIYGYLFEKNGEVITLSTKLKEVKNNE